MESGPGECVPVPWNETYIHLSKFFHPGNFERAALFFAALSEVRKLKTKTKTKNKARQGLPEERTA